jgi:hypothetical protein
MTPSIDDLLRETGETDTIDNAAQTPSPADLEKLANEPATMLWTLRLVQRSSAACWVKTWVRSFRIRLAYVIGAAIAAQALVGIGGYFVVRAALRESVRGAVIEVLKEHKLITQVENLREFVALGPR